MDEIKNDVIDYHEIIECIVSALDAKDTYTAGHSQRVSDMAKRIGSLMRLSYEEQEQVHIAAHLHDIGKIGIPDAILNKTTQLSDEEWKLVKRHPAIGAEILSKSYHLNELKNMVLYHHEQFNGNGYPEGRKGEQIPLGSRIIAIADSIDAMASNRSYRKSYDFPVIYNELVKNSGIMYDPEIIKLVIKDWDYVINQYKK